MFCFISGYDVMKKYCLDTLKEQGLVKETECPSNSSRTGYGGKIPTQYKVFIDAKWRRVYCRIYSNIGTLYFLSNKERVIID